MLFKPDNCQTTLTMSPNKDLNLTLMNATAGPKMTIPKTNLYQILTTPAMSLKHLDISLQST